MDDHYTENYDVLTLLRLFSLQHAYNFYTAKLLAFEKFVWHILHLILHHQSQFLILGLEFFSLEYSFFCLIYLALLPWSL